jgi:hypothetical protein
MMVAREDGLAMLRESLKASREARNADIVTDVDMLAAAAATERIERLHQFS